MNTRERLAAVVIVAASVLTLTIQPVPLGPPGIDPGWQWMVNAAGGEGWTFGRDVAFTYGPLGWIAAPQDQRGHVWWTAAFELFLQLCLATVLIARLRRAPEHWSALVASAVVWIAAVGLGLRFEGRVVLVTALLCLDGVHERRRLALSGASALASLVLFVKMSLGIAAGATVVVALAILAHRVGWRAVVLPAAVAAAVGLTTAAATIGSPNAVYSWLRLSVDIVSGYASAGSIVGSIIVLWTGLAILGVILALGYTAYRQGHGWAVLVLLPGLLIHFRLAFVRQDGHQYLFAPYVIGLIAVAIPWQSAVTQWRTAIASAAGLTALAAIGGAVPWSPLDVPRAIVGHLPGPSSLTTIVRPAATRASLHEASRHNLESLALPESWLLRILGSGERVSVIPWEVMYGPANDLPLAPLRTMQLYSAYTPRLDAWSADLFTGDRAPGWVLDDFAPTGKRRALFDAPATWRAIYRHYDVTEVRWNPFLALLHRRQQPLTSPLLDRGTISFETAGPGLAVPATDSSLLFAAIDLPTNLFGRLNRSAFRVPLIMALFSHRDGGTSQCRLIPSNTGAGILVDPFPRTVDDYVGLWVGRPTSPVQRIRLQGPGLRYHSPVAAVRWLQLEVGREQGPKAQPERPAGTQQGTS